MPKRLEPQSSSLSPPSKRQRTCSASPASSPPDFDDNTVQSSPLNVFLVDAKLSAEVIEELTSLIDSDFSSNGHPSLKERAGSHERQLHLCLNVKDADIIITAVHMRTRLERHVDWSTAKQKAIVTPQWLRDSVSEGQLLPCGKYAAFGELYEETVRNCPDDHCQDCQGSSAPPQSPSSTPPASESGVPRSLNTVLGKESSIRYNHLYACMRHSPLICVNQELVKQFGVLRHQRELEGQDLRALSYERIISVLKAYPYLITLDNIHDVSKLIHIGEKTFSKIQEYIEDGEISECRDILSDTRYRSLSAFTTIHGIGPSTARKLYSIGCRTLEDLERYYDVAHQTSEDTADSLTPETLFVKQAADGSLPQLSIKTGLALRHELATRIPRDEVEEIRDVVMRELAHIQQGCISTITGGYRRGKAESNDIDIVICKTPRSHNHGDNQVKELCTALVRRLYDRRLVTHVMHLSSFREPNALRTGHWDSLEKALVVFKLPDINNSKRPNNNREPLHRRLDLIFTTPETYWSAVVGWTGSKMFERDLRLWAKEEKGMKFDSNGITRRHDSKLYYPRSEQEVFELLGLEWIDPTLRNADL